jgi:hypothetical protein
MFQVFHSYMVRPIDFRRLPRTFFMRLIDTASQDRPGVLHTVFDVSENAAQASFDSFKALQCSSPLTLANTQTLHTFTPSLGHFFEMPMSWPSHLAQMA